MAEKQNREMRKGERREGQSGEKGMEKEGEERNVGGQNIRRENRGDRENR